MIIVVPAAETPYARLPCTCSPPIVSVSLAHTRAPKRRDSDCGVVCRLQGMKMHKLVDADIDVKMPIRELLKRLSA